jgi:predicted TIM-barrel fold metal-dependent hydrolase
MIDEAPQDIPLVDTHAHVYTLDLPLSETAWHRPASDASIEQYIKALDDHGVQYGVLAGASIFGDYNDYQIDALRRYKRLRGTVVIRPDTDRYILEMMKADGVVGVRFQWRNAPEIPDLTTAEYRRFLRRIADLDWHVHVHDDGPRLIKPIEVLEASGVKLVVDHFGRPLSEAGINCEGFQAVLRSVERGRTWVKLASGFRLGSPDLAQSCAKELLKSAGPDRLFWGSDWPFASFESTMTYQQAIDDFVSWVPDPVARRKIGGETALKFYFS